MASNRNNFFGLGIVPSSSTSNSLPGDLEYLTSDGKLHIRGASANDAVVQEALAQTLTNKTLTTPIISSILNTGTITLPTSSDTLVGRSTTDTLINKSISGATNTLTAIPNAALSNSSITINGSSVSLGGTVTVSATATAALTIGTGLNGSSYNGSTAVTVAIDSTVATLTGTQTLTNKTLTTPTLTTPTLNTPKADTISAIGSTLGLNATILQLNNLQVANTTISDIGGTNGVIVTSSNVSNGITLNATGGSNAIQLQNGSTTRVRVNTGSVDLPSATPLRLYDSTTTNYVGLVGPSSVTSSYTITFPAAAPAASTSLVYNGSNYVWSAVSGSGGGFSVYTNNTLTASGYLNTQSTTNLLQVYRIQGTAGNGPITLNNQTLGVSNADGCVYRLFGTSDANNVTLVNSDSVGGAMILRGNATLLTGCMIELQYFATPNRWYEVSRNF